VDKLNSTAVKIGKHEFLGILKNYNVFAGKNLMCIRLKIGKIIKRHDIA
jgi:hypothetical protein